MSIYIITGAPGSGKTLSAVGRIRDYMRQGRKVATNLDLRPEYLVGMRNRQTIIRLPDFPRPQDLFALGTGSGLGPDDYDESKFGLCVLDEMGSWLNSRDWASTEFREMFSWFTQSRKYHWDLILLIQDFESMDKQIRQSLCEFVGRARRFDVLAKMVRLHVCTVRYGANPAGMKRERWWYRGRDLFRSYRTGQTFQREEIYTPAGPVDFRASYSVLSAWHLVGRYRRPRRVSDVFRWILGGYLLLCIHCAARWHGRSPRQQAREWGLLRCG